MDRGANIERIDTLDPVAPDNDHPNHLKTPGTLCFELSLAVRGPEGLVLLVGCSHPGIETILEAWWRAPWASGST